MFSRSSIFSFETLQGIPSLRHILIMLVFLTLLIYTAHRTFFNRKNYLLLLEGDSGIIALELLNKRGGDDLPKILIAGDSRNGCGIIPRIIEEKTGLPTAKITLDASTVWEVEKLLNHNSSQTEEVRVLLFDLDSNQFYEQGNFLQRGNSYLILRDREDCYPGYKNADRYSWKNDYFPLKISLQQVINICTYHLNWNKSNHSEKKKCLVRDSCTPENLSLSLNTRKAAKFNDRLLPALYSLLEICSNRGILVIFNTLPTYEGRNFMYGPVGIPNELCDTDLDKAYEVIYNKLYEQGKFIELGFRRFSDIGVFADEEELFIDHHHLQPLGAEIYTNWLTEEMLKNPKICSALGVSSVEANMEEEINKYQKQKETP